MRSLIIYCLSVYKKWVSPLLPASCIYYPSCSDYARQAIGSQGLWRGCLLAFLRLMRCHPWGKGGFDPPPSGKRC